MTTDTTDPIPPAAPSPPPVPARRLTRRTDDRLLGGVASGLGDHFGLDPVLVRIGFVILGAFGGGGVVLYVALWLLVPERESGEVLAGRAAGWAEAEGRRIGSDRGPAFWLGVALIALASIAILDSAFDGGVVAALVLIGIGVALFRSDGGGPRADASVDAAGRPAPAVRRDGLHVDGQPVDEGPRDDLSAAGTVPPGPPIVPRAEYWPPVPPPAPRPRRERSILGRLTLGLAVLWVGVASFLDQASTSIDFTAAGVVGVAMAIIGGGLLVGAWAGRARWLTLVGVLLVPILLGATFADRIRVPFASGVGERSFFVPVTQTVVDEDLFAGEMTIDLVDGPSAVYADDLGSEDRRVRARVGAGELTVIVPAHWPLDVDARVGVGEILVQGAGGMALEGVDRELRQSFSGEPGTPTVFLELDVSVGQIRIDRQEVAR